MGHFPKSGLEKYWNLCRRDRREHNDDYWNDRKPRQQADQNEHAASNLKRTDDEAN